MFGRTEAHPSEHRSGQAKGTTQAELQDALLRFEGRFSARLEHAFEQLGTSKSIEVRVRARRERVLYEASALDIATGPTPESNLLDMVTFVELARETAPRRWNQDAYGERGAPVTAALEAAAADVWGIARKLLGPPEEEGLRTIIREWREQNPDVDQIANVRLASLSTIAGESRSQEFRGLFASVRKGVDEADMARLLGERALFVARRMPLLIHLQVRLVVSEVLQEIIDEVPARVATIVSRIAAQVVESVRKVLVTGAVATASFAAVGALAFAILR